MLVCCMHIGTTHEQYLEVFMELTKNYKRINLHTHTGREFDNLPTLTF